VFKPCKYRVDLFGQTQVASLRSRFFIYFLRAFLFIRLLLFLILRSLLSYILISRGVNGLTLSQEYGRELKSPFIRKDYKETSRKGRTLDQYLSETSRFWNLLATITAHRSPLRVNIRQYRYSCYSRKKDSSIKIPSRFGGETKDKLVGLENKARAIDRFLLVRKSVATGFKFSGKKSDGQLASSRSNSPLSIGLMNYSGARATLELIP